MTLLRPQRGPDFKAELGKFEFSTVAGRNILEGGFHQAKRSQFTNCSNVVLIKILARINAGENVSIPAPQLNFLSHLRLSIALAKKMWSHCGLIQGLNPRRGMSI